MKPRLALAAGSLALLGAASTLAPQAVSAGPVCPDTLNVIVSSAAHIKGTDCADLIFASGDVTSIDSLAGNDIVNVSDRPGTTELDLSVDLGAGNDRLTSFRSHGWQLNYSGGGGDDRLQTRTRTSGTGYQTLRGGDGDDVLAISGLGTTFGDGGNDQITATPGIGALEEFTGVNIHNFGGAGNDVIDTRAAVLGWTVDAPDFNIADGGIGDDTLLTSQTAWNKHEIVDGGDGKDTAVSNQADSVYDVEKVTKKN